MRGFVTRDRRRGDMRIAGACVGDDALAIPLAYFSLPPQESVPKRAWPQQSRDSAVS